MGLSKAGLPAEPGVDPTFLCGTPYRSYIVCDLDSERTRDAPLKNRPDFARSARIRTSWFASCSPSAHADHAPPNPAPRDSWTRHHLAASDPIAGRIETRRLPAREGAASARRRSRAPLAVDSRPDRSTGGPRRDGSSGFAHSIRSISMANFSPGRWPPLPGRLACGRPRTHGDTSSSTRPKSRPNPPSSTPTR